MKIHTRAKRKLGLSSSFRHKSALEGKKRKHRAKTFKTEKSANDYAAKKGLKDFSLKKVKKNKKFQIVLK